MTYRAGSRAFNSGDDGCAVMVTEWEASDDLETTNVKT